MTYKEINNQDRQNEYKAFLSISDYVENDSRLFFANTNFNAMVIVDKSTWLVEQIVSFEGEERTASNMHLRCVEKQGKICFLPAERSWIHIYDIKNKKQYVYNVSEGEKGYWDYFVFKDQVYLLPGCGIQKLWKWNVVNNAIEKECWWNVFPEDAGLKHGSMGEECFYTLVEETNQLYITNMSRQLVERHSLPDEQVTCITYDGENFWYTIREVLDIVCWNKERGVIDRFPIHVDIHWENEGNTYFGITFAEGKIFLFLSDVQSMYVYVLDEEERNLKCIHKINCKRGAFWDYEQEPFFKAADGNLICMLKNAGEIVLINLETLEAEQYCVNFDGDIYVQEYINRILLDKGALLYEEQGILEIRTLIDYCMETGE